MSDINRVILVGRLTKDAELKYQDMGTSPALCRFAIAVNRSRKGDAGWVDEPSFIDIKWFGNGVDSASKWLTKGCMVAIEGSLRQDKWTDSQGNQRSTLVVYADKVQFMRGREQGESTQEYAPRPVQRVPEPDHFDDEGIPF